ncbi:UNVERIFIED_CONTAM: Carotenoid 9,10(9',10')-cleavage dioxygenase 1 [Sesamum latifolium]|uniref:Carotenoid 9,10(9',10')-cleavage dioxygenase 1 n=1 Tax=Sesamum latifolium TaxID=2727402 RepID=A0AAW2SNQ2_9LAMI
MSCSAYAFPLMISCSTAESSSSSRRPPRIALPKPSTSANYSSSSSPAIYKALPISMIRETPGKLLDALVDQVFEFVDQPYLPSQMRFGVPNKNMSNTNVFEQAGKYYTAADCDVAPHQIHIPTLETIGTWDEIAESWNRPFTSHPKKAPGTGELVIIGIDAKNPYLVLGVISVRWFGVKSCCAFHIINCYEEDDEVVVMGCIAQDSIIPGPDLGRDKLGWFSRGLKKVSSYHQNMEEGFLFARPYEWRLNMKTGQVKEKYLVALDFAMDFPMINDNFIGVKNKFAYTQVVDSAASSAAENSFCTGASFVAKQGAADEDDGWLITFVHNEDTNTSEVYIVDAKKISSEAVAKIRLPCRVPYGFHGAYMPLIKHD